VKRKKLGMSAVDCDVEIGEKAGAGNRNVSPNITS